MKRPIRWSREALDDIKEQADFIAQDNPAAARRVVDHIRDTGNSLGEFATGRPGRVGGTYEKSTPRLPYIIAYTIIGNAVIIVRVVHTSRDWPEGEWPKAQEEEP